MDINQSVNIVINGDNKPINQAMDQTVRKVQETQNRIERVQATRGKAASEAYGRAFNQAQDRWLKVAEDGFRRYGGRFGGIVADIIGQYDKIGKAREATERLRGVERGVGIVDTVGATAVGAGIGSSIVSGGASIRTNIARRISERILERSINSASQYLERGKFPGGMSWDQMVSKYPHLADSELFHTRAQAKSLIGIVPGIERKLKPSTFDKTAETINALRESNTPYRDSITLLKRGVETVATPSLLTRIGLVTGAIVGYITAINKLGKAFDELKEKKLEFAKNDQTIKEIEAIGNSAERTAEILKRFGADGQEAFRKLNEEQKTLGKDIANSEVGSGMKFTAGAISSYVGEKASKGWNFLKGMGNWMLEGASRLNPWAVSDKEAKEVLQTEIDAKKAQEKLDKKRALLAEDFNTMVDKENKAIEESIKIREAADKSMEDLTDAVREETDRYNQKQRSIEDQSRWSIGDLAGQGGAAGQAANKVQNLEAQAKMARLSGNHQRAESLIQQANVIRNNLGMAGITTSNEYGSNYSTDMGGFAIDNSPMGRAYMLQIARVAQYGKAMGRPDLQSAAQDFLNRMKTGRLSEQKKSLDQFYAENGYLNIKAKMSK